MSDNPLVADWLRRLDAVEVRLRAQATRSGGKTSTDPKTGEAWERGQVWGHISEFVPFWTEQVTDVIDEYRGEPIAYGRSPDQAERRTGIDSGLELSIDVLWEEVRSDLADLRQILTALPEGWEKAVGLHATQGEVPANTIIERTLISHLEEHAAQLEAIG